jgi:ribonucleoside-diphosphate reductase alpha chain
VSFLTLFNATGSVIGVHGRRAAEMVALSCEHPDIEEFLKIKQTDHKLEAMNISMLLTSKFMDAIKENKPFELHFDVPESKEKIRKTIDTRKFYREFCQTQWDYGDPGSIFIDPRPQL